MRRIHLPIHKRLAHIIGLFFCWGLYGTGILYVIASPESVNVYWGLFIAVTVEFCLFVIVIITWIRRHLFLHRTLQPRKAIPGVSWVYTQDYLGYTVKGIAEHLKDDKFITINCEEDTKVKSYKALLPVKPKPKTETKPKIEAKAKTKIETKTKLKPKIEAKVNIKTEIKPKAKPKTKIKIEPKTKAKPKATSTTKAKLQPKAKAAPKAKLKPKTKTKAKANTKTKAKANTKTKD
ncbi:MAG: hypothetical protein WCG04_02275 [Alphaproteobacteria bacterium]